MKQKIGVLGSGSVGQTLAAGFQKHGYEVRIATRHPDKLKDFSAGSGIAAGSFPDVAGWGEMLVLAVKGSAALASLKEIGAAPMRGKTVIDTTNPIADAPPVDGVVQFFTGPNSSLLEQLQAAQPETRFVKCFSVVGAAKMVDPVFRDGRPSMFICGNDAEARKSVTGVLDEFGWETFDMGSAVAARAIEPLCQLWCIPGFKQNHWTHAFKLLWD